VYDDVSDEMENGFVFCFFKK